MQQIKEVDSLLHTIYSAKLPGAAIGVVNEGKVIYKKGFGISNIDKPEKITSATDFNIASLTKQFTAMAILQLLEKKQLSLSDNLAHFFPSLHPVISEKITVRQLLTHSSGIPDHYSLTDTKNLKHAYDADVLRALGKADSTYFTPGLKFQYSNTAYCLLAMIIEKISGISFAEYLEKNIFQTANMLHSKIWNEHAKISNAAIGYHADSSGNFIKSQAEENIFFSTEGDGGIYTSVDDYINWFRALQTGRVASQKSIEEARSIQFPFKNKNCGYGFGWFIDSSNGFKKVYHSGSNGGFRTYSFTIPSRDFLIVIFSNRDDVELEKLVLQMCKILLPGVAPFTPEEHLTS